MGLASAEQVVVNYREIQQDLTELNGEGNRDRGHYGEDESKAPNKDWAGQYIHPTEHDESDCIEEGKLEVIVEFDQGC